MRDPVPRRPASPSPAERARTIAARRGLAALLPSTDANAVPASAKVSPLLHHVHDDGTATVLLSEEHSLVESARGAILTGMLEVTDRTPVALREPVRGLLWITGWLRLLDPDDARTAALAVAEQRPDSRLLDVGHGAAVLQLSPATLVLADGEGSCPVSTSEFSAATPDPFCLHEDQWLRHLEVEHRDVVGLLSRHVPEHLRGGHIRPLGLDKCGVRLRVESADGDHDVRLAFSRPVYDAEHLGTELRRLVGCPFLAGQRG